MFRIVTDTSANLPTAYLQQEHITIIPFTFHADGDEQACLDLNTFDAKTFYAQMRSGTKVSTSQIPPQRYLDVLTPRLLRLRADRRAPAARGIPGAQAPAR